ncbi:MAG: hypothetical protein ACRD2U_13595 [Terriglobales bacterium]
MKRLASLLLGSSLLIAASGIVAAQETTAETTPPPKVLSIFREFVKPGKAGSIHEKSESAFVQAFSRAKWPTHYFAVDSLSGKPRALFLTGYDSLDAWEKDNKAIQKNAMLSAALDRAADADGQLLSDTDAGIFVFREDQSLNAPVDIAHMRYFEISLYVVRPGHRHEWNEAVKLVKAAYEQIPGSHWAMYQMMFGQQHGSAYAVFVPRKSAAEIDESFANDKKFAEAMGEDGMKKLGDLESSAIESSQTNLFQFNPRMSYPPDAWVKADPDFWKPKMHMGGMASKKPKEPAAAQ